MSKLKNRAGTKVFLASRKEERRDARIDKKIKKEREFNPPLKNLKVSGFSSTLQGLR